MRKKTEGDTLGEKIEKELEKIHKKKISFQIDDAFFNIEKEEGLPFYCRRTNYLRPNNLGDYKFGRYFDIPDEVQIRQDVLKAAEEVETNRDRTF